MVHVVVQGTEIYSKADSKVTSGTVGRQVEFTFDSTWDNLDRIAVFKSGNISRDVDLDATDVCNFPWEVLAHENVGQDIFIGVCGMRGDEIVYPTVYTNLGKLEQGASMSENPAAEPTPSIFQQFVDAANEAKDIAQSVRDDADAGEFDGKDGIDGADGKSAYEIALDNGFVGTEEEWVKSLSGKDGVGVFYVDGKVEEQYHADKLTEDGVYCVKNTTTENNYPFNAESCILLVQGNGKVQIAFESGDENRPFGVYSREYVQEQGGWSSWKAGIDIPRDSIKTSHLAQGAVSSANLADGIPLSKFVNDIGLGDEEFVYGDYNIPVIYFEGDISAMSKDNEVALNYQYGDMSGTCTLKWQGSSSLTYPKKNYTVKFDTAFEAADGWGEQKKYCLKADWVDFSHSRNVVSAKLWGEIVKSRSGVNETLAALPNAGAIDGFPCFVVVNGKWQGIYNFNIPKDGWMMGMGGGEKEAIVCAGNNYDGTKFLREAIVADGKDFEPEYNSDGFSVSEIQDSINTLIRAVLNSDGSDIDTTIAQYLDIDSAIDYYIFFVACGGTDIISKNYILATYDGVKWFFSAYDLDSTWGMRYDGAAFYASGYTDGGASDVKFKRMVELSNQHALFKLLYLHKREAIIARYNKLRSRVLTHSNISKLFTNYIGCVPRIAFDAENELWTDIPSTGTNNVNQIVNWVADRLPTMDKEISELADMLDDVSTDDLAYTTAWTGTRYEVTCEGIGTAADADIVVAKYIDDNPVTKVKNNAFQNNTNITSVVLKDGIKTIGSNAFAGTTNLAKAEMPDSVESIGASAFMESGVTEIEVPRNVTAIPGYFAAKAKLKNLNMGNRVRNVGDYAFQNCPDLESVRLSNNLHTISQRAFRLCAKLASVRLPASLRTIGDHSFNSTGLTEIAIPAKVKTVGEQAFGYCASMDSVRFNGVPESVAYNAFYGCTALKDIYVPWAQGTVAGAPWGATSATVHYNS